nr:immunoglobulin heavy chain junction region [Mus musculus]
CVYDGYYPYYFDYW